MHAESLGSKLYRPGSHAWHSCADTCTSPRMHPRNATLALAANAEAPALGPAVARMGSVKCMDDVVPMSPSAPRLPNRACPATTSACVWPTVLVEPPPEVALTTMGACNRTRAP